MNAVSYIDRAEALAEAKQYYESMGKEFDAKTREIVLAIHDATKALTAGDMRPACVLPHRPAKTRKSSGAENAAFPIFTKRT